MPMKYFHGESIPFKILAGGIPVLLGIYMAINPFPHKTAIENISFYSSVLFASILVAAGKRPLRFRNPLTLPFALFAVWSAVGLCFALDFTNSLHDLYAHLIQYLILLYLIVNFFRTERYLTILIGIVIFSGAVFALWAMTAFYIIQGFPLDTKLGLTSLDELSSNIIGILTLFPAVLALGWIMVEKNRYRRAAAFVCIAILGMATLATMARSALFAMAAALAIMIPLLLRNRRIFLSIVILLVLAVATMPVKERFTPTDFMDKVKATDRFSIALTYIEMVKDYPLTGIGFGMEAYGEKGLLEKYHARLPVEYRQQVPARAPHNSLIDVAVRTGLPGLGLFLYIIYSFVRMGIGLIKTGGSPYVREWGRCLLASFAALFIQSLFENTLSGPPAVALFAVMAMMAALWHLEHERAPGRETNLA